MSIIDTSLRSIAVERVANSAAERADSTVELILGGAYELLERDGLFKLKLRDLLTQTGLSRRAFYQHFPSMDALLATLVEETYRTMVRELDERLVDAPGFDACLGAWIDGVLSFAIDTSLSRRGRVFIVEESRLSTTHRDTFRAVGQSIVDRLSTVLKAGTLSGDFSCSDPDADARLVFQLTLSVMQRHVLDGTKPTSQERNALLNFVDRAIRKHS